MLILLRECICCGILLQSLGKCGETTSGKACCKEQMTNYEDMKVCVKFLDQGRCSVNPEELPLNYSPDPSLHGEVNL